MLTVDIGRRTGWCICAGGGYVESGVHELYSERAKHRPWSDGERFVAFDRFLRERGDGCGVVAFEQVHGGAHTSTRQISLYSGFRAILMRWAAERQIPVVPIPVATIKKCLSGKGNASKAQMVESARHIGLAVWDDNEADAIGIAIALHMLPDMISKQSASDQLTVDKRRAGGYGRARVKTKAKGNAQRDRREAA